VAARERALYRVVLPTPTAVSSGSDYVLRVSLTVTSGRASLFVSCGDNNPHNASDSNWFLAPVLPDSLLEISSLSLKDRKCFDNNNNNNNGNSGRSLFVTVSAEIATAYSLEASLNRNHSARTLLPSQSLRGSLSASVSSQQIEYFVVHVSGGLQRDFLDATLRLTVFAGEAVLFASHNWDARPRLTSTTVAAGTTSASVNSAESGPSGPDGLLLISHHVLQRWCVDRVEDCYFVVAVVGTSSSSSSTLFSLQFTWADRAVALTAGVPQRGQVGAMHTEFYKFSLAQRNSDVVFAVSAISGDPGTHFYSTVSMTLSLCTSTCL
jgi:hypothetical protein